MSDVSDQVGARALSGVRWAIVFNAVTIPLSFVTNLILGRTSPLALGQFSAIQIFVGGFLALFLPGGRDVFTRIVPRLGVESRAGFVATYTAMVVAGVGFAWAAARLLFPAWATRALEPFGIPGLDFALPFLLIISLWSISSFFLYGTLNGPQASFTLRVVVFAFFIVVIAGAGPFREQLTGDPVTFLWWGAAAAYGIGTAVGFVLLLSTAEIRSRARLSWTFPAGFWNAVGYTHLATIITFLYTNLSPSFVLLSLDREALARIHVPLRYGILLNALPLISSPVVSSTVARLDSQGERDRGLRNAATAMRGSTLLVAPAAFALILFAPDAMAVFNPAFRADADLLRWIVPAALAGSVVHLGVGLATGLGAFRSYVAASSAFVIIAIGLNVVLIPRFGLHGAAIAIPIAAFVQQSSLAFVLRRRLGFSVPNRVYAAWTVAVALSVATTMTDVSRSTALIALAVSIAVFAWLGGVTLAEIKSLTTRFFGRAGH